MGCVDGLYLSIVWGLLVDATLTRKCYLLLTFLVKEEG